MGLWFAGDGVGDVSGTLVNGGEILVGVEGRGGTGAGSGRVRLPPAIGRMMLISMMESLKEAILVSMGRGE